MGMEFWPEIGGKFIHDDIFLKWRTMPRATAQSRKRYGRPHSNRIQRSDLQVEEGASSDSKVIPIELP